MRSWSSGRGWVGLALLALAALLTLRHALHAQGVKVGELGEQLNVLRASYRQLAGLPEAPTKMGSFGKGYCKAETKVAFAKTHKTGSSTLQNIFFRFGDARELTFAIPERSWMYSFKEPFNHTMISKLPWARLGYDLFVFHSVWNYNEVKKVLPSAVYITLLRDPVDCYESNYVYMGLQKAFKMDINKFAQIKAAAKVPRRRTAIIGKNQLLWDLGMPGKDMDNPQAVKTKIQQLDTQFDFVLLAEFFDESLVILAKVLCWDLSELRYLKLNARKGNKVSNITTEARTTLTEWLAADYQLYDHFKAKFNAAVESYGKAQLDEDVGKLRQLNKKLEEECVLEVTDNTKLKGEFKTALDMVEGYMVDPEKPWCAPFARSEPNFSVKLRNKQKAKVGQARDILLRGLSKQATAERRRQFGFGSR